MKTYHKFFRLFSGLVLVLILSQCSKERLEEKEPELNKYGSLDAFYTTYRPAEQTFTINRNGKGPIIGKHGTKMWVDSTIFMYSNGTDITYPFTIRLLELYSPKDMILYNMPTVSGGQLLVTGGEIRVRAFKDADELVLKPGKVYPTYFPGPAADPKMEIFYGKQLGSLVDWTNAPSTTVTVDSGYYKALLPKIGWINCDYFYNYSSKTTIAFSSKTDDLTNVAKFLYFDGIKSLMQVYGNTSGEIPVGTSVKIICFAANDQGKLFYYSKSMTTGASNPLEIELTEVSESNLIAHLAGL